MDIQARLQKAKSPSYERWARGFNLKEMAKTFSYLREHDLLDSSNDRIFFFNRENCFVKGKNNVKTKTCSRAADNGNILDKINAPFTVLEMVKGAHLPCPAETKHREIIELGRFAGKVQRRFTHGFQHLPGHG